MSGVKWIKITTNMFEDEKIDFIESLPECDAILIIWIKLLAQAGKTNSNGFIFLTEQIPYTDEMLSHKFRRPLNTVKLALQTLKQLDMITFNEEGYLKISNWEKHQNIEGLDKIREQNRIRQERYREKQKQLSSNVTVTLRNGTDIELEEELEEELEDTPEKKVETSKKFDKSSIEYKISDYMYKCILKNDTKYKKPNLQNWAVHIDYLIRLDGRSPAEIKSVIKFVTTDDFEKANVLSTRKLRERFGQLYIKTMNAKGTKISNHKPREERNFV